MYEKGREQLEDVVVKLSRPRLASKDLTYDIKVIEGFYRFVELNRKLISADVVNWVADPRKEVAFDILITGYAPTYSEQVREYLTLLGLPMSKEESEDIVITGFISMIPICAPRCFTRRCGYYGPSALLLQRMRVPHQY